MAAFFRGARPAQAALLVVLLLPQQCGSLIAPAPARRRSTTPCTRRHAKVNDDAVATRRSLLKTVTVAGAAVVLAGPRAASAARDDGWWGAEGILDWVANDRQQTAVASRVSSAYYSAEFVTYLSRFLLNFDGSCAAWWAQQVANVPPSYGERRREEALAAKFESFSSSVEYGLRRYPGASGRVALLRSLTAQHGDDVEKRRHLALAFTLLGGDKQPVDGIRYLLIGVPVYGGRTKGSVGALLPPTFSPGLADYLERDPLALLPRTQVPVLDVTGSAYEIRGLAPFVASGARGASNPFGKRGERGIGREKTLDLATYSGFALSGLIGCSATHAVLVPIDVVKTRLQTDPDRYDGVLDGAKVILQEEGVRALFLGAEATLAGYCWYGLTVYPGYEFWSRELNGLGSPAVATEFHAPIVLLAGALATVLACVGVCPAEALRIRVVADPARFEGLGLFESASLVADDEGADAFYAGFRPLVIRQVIFGMVKFFFFDSLADAIFEAAPQLADGAGGRLAVSLLAGLVAGTASSLVSQPADAVLSRINADRGDLDVLGAVEAIWGEGAVRGFYRGAAARCAWSGLVISGQFAIYDALKSLLSVAGPDLTLFLDVAL